MSMWKDNTGPPAKPRALAPEAKERGPVRAPPSKPELVPVRHAPAPVARADPGLPRKESLIAADITIEGKIEGGGSVRIAGKFKGDVSVLGDLTVEAGAKLTGGVRADTVTIAGELEGSVEQASRIDLLHDRRGDRRPEGGFADGRRRCPHARSSRVRLGRRQGPEDRQARTARRAAPAYEQRAPGHPRGDPPMSALPGDHPRKRSGVSGLPALPALRCRRRGAAGARAHAAAHRRQHPASCRRRALGNTRSSCRFATIAAKKSPISSSAWVA